MCGSEKRNLCRPLASDQREHVPLRARELDLDYWSGNVSCKLMLGLQLAGLWDGLEPGREIVESKPATLKLKLR